MKLTTLYQHLHARAQLTGEWRGAELAGGARLDVRAGGSKTKVIFSRRGKQLGATELITFCRDCSVPDSATRTPANAAEQASRADGDDTIWYVQYAWSSEEPTYG